MAILKAGTSTAEFNLTGSWTGGASSANQSPFVNECLLSQVFDSSIELSEFSESGFWLSYYVSSGLTDREVITFRNSGDAFLRLSRISGEFQFQSWSGSAWVNVGSSFTGITSSRQRLDIGISLQASGFIRLYVDKLSVFDFTGDTVFNSISVCDEIILRTLTTSGRISGLILADEDTRPLEYAQLLPSGAGALEEWTGNASDVSGSVSFNDSTMMTTDLADQKQTFALPNLPSAFNTGYTVEAIVANVRARRDPDKVADLRLMALSGTDEAFGDQVSLANEAEVVQGKFSVDPATSAAWTIAGVNGAEIGVQSRAG